MHWVKYATEKQICMNYKLKHGKIYKKNQGKKKTAIRSFLLAGRKIGKNILMHLDVAAAMRAAEPVESGRAI
jgi:hypothetical protein